MRKGNFQIRPKALSINGLMPFFILQYYLKLVFLALYLKSRSCESTAATGMQTNDSWV